MLPLPVCAETQLAIYSHDKEPARLRRNNEVRTKPVLQRRRNRSQVVLKTDVYIAAYLLPPGKLAKLGSTERLNQAVPFTLSSFATLPGRAGALYRMPPPLPNRFVGGYTGSAPTAGSRGKTQGTRKASALQELYSVSAQFYMEASNPSMRFFQTAASSPSSI